MYILCFAFYFIHSILQSFFQVFFDVFYKNNSFHTFVKFFHKKVRHVIIGFKVLSILAVFNFRILIKQHDLYEIF